MKSTRTTLILIIWLFLQQFNVAVNASELMSGFIGEEQSEEHCHDDHSEGEALEKTDVREKTSISCCEIGCDCCIGGCYSVLDNGFIFTPSIKPMVALDFHLFSLSSVPTYTLYRPPISTLS